MAQRVIINDPILNELTFDYLFTLSEGQRAKLNAKELRAIRTANRARQFVSRATIDEKLFLLAKLGVQYSFILHANNPIATKEIKELYTKYKEMSKVQVIDDMAANKFVVLTDRVLINFLNIMAHNSHSDTYLLNMDFHKVGQHMNNWKQTERADVDNIQEALDHAKAINRLSLNISIHLKSIKGITQIGDLDFNILMLLYNFKTQYVLREKIESYFGGMYKKTLIAAAIKRLTEKILIERNPASKKIEYQITALGNTSVMEFHRKNLSDSV